MTAPKYGRSVAPFTCNTSAGNQTISFPNAVGVVPKAVMFFITRATADSITNTAMLGGGIRAGSVSRAFCYLGEHNTATVTADIGTRADSGNVIELTVAGSQNREAAATFVSFNTDNCIINWTTALAPAAAYLGYAVFFWGEDLQVDLQTIAGNATQDAGTTSTSLGFTPDGLIAISVNRDFTTDGAGQDGQLCIGWAGRLPSVTQSCSCVVGEDNAVTATGAGDIIRDDSVATLLVCSGGTVTEAPRLEASFGADTYTLTTRGAAGTLRAAVLAYSIGGRRVWCGAEVMDTNGTGNKSLTTPGFRPGSVQLAMVLDTSSNTLVQTAGSITIGASSGLSGESSSVSWQWRDNVATSVAKSRTSPSFIQLIGTGGAAMDLTASFVSFDAVGVTLNLDSPSANDRPISFCLWEEFHLVSPDAENIADAHVARISQASGDTERTTDAHAFKPATAQSDTERIADAFAFKLALQSPDTERINDQHVARISQASGDTENVSDAFVFLRSTPFTSSDTERITDGFVAIVAATANSNMVAGDTEDIFESVDLVVQAVLVANDTERISDVDLLYLGRLIISADTERITDGFGGSRIVLRRGIQRARIDAGGAELGIVNSPHSARGDVV